MFLLCDERYREEAEQPGFTHPDNGGMPFIPIEMVSGKWLCHS